MVCGSQVVRLTTVSRISAETQLDRLSTGLLGAEDMSVDAEDLDAGEAEDMTCLVYINPEGIDKHVLEAIKGKVVHGLDDDDGMNAWSVHFEEVALPYRDLLAMATANKSFYNSCFFILNQESAKKGAVLCCETRSYIDLKGMAFRYPSAASTRRFYLAPAFASAMAVNLSIANMDFEDFSSGFGHAHLRRGEVSEPW